MFFFLAERIPVSLIRSYEGTRIHLPENQKTLKEIIRTIDFSIWTDVDKSNGPTELGFVEWFVLLYLMPACLWTAFMLPLLFEGRYLPVIIVLYVHTSILSLALTDLVLSWSKESFIKKWMELYCVETYKRSGASTKVLALMPVWGCPLLLVWFLLTRWRFAQVKKQVNAQLADERATFLIAFYGALIHIGHQRSQMADPIRRLRISVGGREAKELKRLIHLAKDLRNAHTYALRLSSAGPLRKEGRLPAWVTAEHLMANIKNCELISRSSIN